MNKLLNTEKGSALLLTLAIILMLFAAVLMSVDRSTTETELSFNQSYSDKAFYIAQAGLERAKAEIEADEEWRTGFNQTQFGTGKYTVIVLDSSVNSALDDTVVIRSVGQEEHASAIVEILLLKGSYHPLFNHAIYAGNWTEYDPLVDSQTWVSTMDFGGFGGDADEIIGDIHFNGNVNVTGNAYLDGSVTAGGDYTGSSPTGSTNQQAEYLEPPDLKAQNYESVADFVVDGSSPWDSDGWIPETDPRHIFVKDYRSDLAVTYGYNFDNTNYFFGDPYEGKNIDKVSVSADGNKKTYFIDGNLWIEPMGAISKLINSPEDGTQITIVAKGNIYFSDNLSYDNDEMDGLAFIAMTDGESYTDLDGDSQYDPGEPILHDDGDGIYEGPSEGSGNIRFGDPNGGALGDINGFLYADNNFEDYVLDGPDGRPQDFSVNGMLSAGNHLDINRDYSGGHSKMDITYDERLKNGDLDLPGLPKRNVTASGGWVEVGWREQ